MILTATGRKKVTHRTAALWIEQARRRKLDSSMHIALIINIYLIDALKIYSHGSQKFYPPSKIGRMRRLWSIRRDHLQVTNLMQFHLYKVSRNPHKCNPTTKGTNPSRPETFYTTRLSVTPSLSIGFLGPYSSSTKCVAVGRVSIDWRVHIYLKLGNSLRCKADDPQSLASWKKNNPWKSHSTLPSANPLLQRMVESI